MKRCYILLLVAFWSLGIFLPASAQNDSLNKKNTGKKKAELLLEQDTVPSLLYQFYFSELDSLYNDPFYLYNIRLEPDYYRLFVPLTYYKSPMNRFSHSLWEFKEEPDIWNGATGELLPFDKNKYTKLKRAQERTDGVLLSLYLNAPELILQAEDQIMSKEVLDETVKDKVSPKTSVLDLFKPDVVVVNVEPDIVISKPNFWTTGGNGSLQFTQNYISDNWYKGGESTHTLLGNIMLFANYNDKEKVQFENSFEARMGFNTVSSDTVRQYRINTDVLRIYSKLGLQAASKWYYTISGEVNTQFFNNYKKNEDVLVSAFLAPLKLTVSVGMDYKLKKNKVNLSVFISPVTYNLRYVGKDEVDETQFGLEAGKRSLNDFGSKLQSTLEWKIIPSITLNSRLYYFTNYEKVEGEWENTVNFVLNRYLSTKLFVHARFDDAAKREEGKSYFQLQELLSFGINYKW